MIHFVEGHVKCGQCQAMFPKIWLNAKTGASMGFGTFFCSQKCKDVFASRVDKPRIVNVRIV